MWNPDAQCQSHWLLPCNPRPRPIWSPDSQSSHMGPTLPLPPLGDAPTSYTTFLGSRVPQSPLAAQASTPGLINCWMLDCPLYLSCPHTRQSRLPLWMLPQEAWAFAPHNPVPEWNLVWLRLWDLSVSWPPAGDPTFPGARSAVVLGVFSNL